MEEMRKYVDGLIEMEKRSDHIFITYGCDYAFTQANTTF